MFMSSMMKFKYMCGTSVLKMIQSKKKICFYFLKWIDCARDTKCQTCSGSRPETSDSITTRRQSNGHPKSTIIKRFNSTVCICPWHHRIKSNIQKFCWKWYETHFMSLFNLESMDFVEVRNTFMCIGIHVNYENYRLGANKQARRFCVTKSRPRFGTASVDIYIKYSASVTHINPFSYIIVYQSLPLLS